MWFVGRGFSNESLASQENTKPDMEIVTRVTGPEVGYVATPIVLVQCALILLSQRKNLLKGGVYPPGIVFGPTDLQQKLQQNGNPLMSSQKVLFLLELVSFYLYTLIRSEIKYTGHITELDNNIEKNFMSVFSNIIFGRGNYY
ncbi:hypothetical protein KIW84_036046 [Lathyrus oleraceus]|uniref:Uncharacterized protein n=1 Tax=Pisum sativum TaxID=3888 RepID=A0A9D4Y7T6_PEA|nr:hypothetical protein KIW84_036046 [Pisum sativum]